MGINAAERLFAEDRRLVILCVLDRAPGSQTNHYVLRDALGDQGHRISLDAVLSELSWLQEQGLVRLEELRDVTVAVLTARGQDASRGWVRIPGVKKPAPGQ